MTQLRLAASGFVGYETRRIKRTARGAGVEVITAFGIMLTLVTGLVLALIGLAFAFEPDLGRGGAFAASGGIAILVALAAAAILLAYITHADRKQTGRSQP